jgi:hypothetical protein
MLHSIEICDHRGEVAAIVTARPAISAIIPVERGVGGRGLRLAAAHAGPEFLQGLRVGAHPAPPFAEVADIWPLAIERGHIVFEAYPSDRFFESLTVSSRASSSEGSCDPSTSCTTPERVIKLK